MALDWTHAFPAAVADRVADAAIQLPPADFENSGLVNASHSRHWPAVVVEGQTVQVPYRMYNPTLTTQALAALPEAARPVLACMYSRHSDGRVRQTAARVLLSCRESFVAPYIVQLLGEYVVQIALDVADAIDELAGAELLALLVSFGRENPQFITLTRERARSYWSEYYRRDFPAMQDYPALVALAALSTSAAEVVDG
ncbi:hypothetical protein EV652_106486 [Kribbella steppae]|uniref:Uncharacterized protein n=1 Tax=Kribbella steppae TaxID=2512223 RepID=A0A4V2RZV2_9ACTN|nr:hypothetical protein [Kribbella steppae]TCO28500.1 hypothetical protein EV652_106486 [Kribbella steppae]